MKKTVLLYNFEDNEKAAAKRALLPLHTAVKEVTDEEMYLPVGFLAGMIKDNDKRDFHAEKSGRLVVMGGFSGSDIDRLLAAMRKAGFGRDVLKAVITPTNAVWCGPELYSEIYKEHRQMGGK